MVDPPLAGLRIVDAVSGPLAPITRYLADLGARVDRVLAVDMRDPGAVAANAGKHIVSSEQVSLTSMNAVVGDLTADIDFALLRRTNPAIVTMAVSDFGAENSLAEWKAGGTVLHALSGVLSRSGTCGRPPLPPPGDLAYQCAAAQAAYALLSALYRALRTGQGAHFDFSALDGVVQALDPGFGINGSATLGRPIGLLSRDRPAAGFQYPILPCADGHVRICLLSKRQWRGMFEWLGRPQQFASPEFDMMAHRYKSPDLLPFIAIFFAKRKRSELEREGQAHGVPINGLNTLQEFIASDQLATRQALRDWIGPDGAHARLPNGMQTIDGVRGAFASVGSGTAQFPAPTPTIASGNAALPFAGLKVLDLGIIVVGAELGRLLGDLGADVVKLETLAFPDGNRQSYLNFGMSVSFAAGHRNKRGLGIDLRSNAGRTLFLELVAKADILCSNFKPGTMEKLGLGKNVLLAANPALIISESSAFGDSGPWSKRMGYGPLVRAATGLTRVWRYSDDSQGFCDAVTVYPDHVAARVCAIGVVALLIRRLRTTKGGVSAVAQSEVMLGHFAEEVLRLTGRFAPPGEISGPSGVFSAEGDDEWCVVDVRNESERAALRGLIGGSSSDLESNLRAWLSQRDPKEAMCALQAVGVPAARMLRVADLLSFAYYAQRELFRVERHPWLKEDVIADCYVAKTNDLPSPPKRSAPLTGEQTEEILADWLTLGSDAIARYSESGVIEPLDPKIRASAQAYLAGVD